jgi:hypothetical protein
MVQLELSIRLYTFTLALTTALLVVTHIALAYLDINVVDVPWLIQQLFHLDEENNLPTWFSSFLLLNNSMVSYWQSSTSKTPIQWRLLALGFLVLSIDEVAGLHETLNTAIEMSWVIPAGILVLLVGLAFIPFLLSLNRRFAGLLLISGMLYVLGAIGIEFLSADMDEESLAYHFATALEEGIEMLGALMFLWINLENMLTKESTDVTLSLRP